MKKALTFAGLLFVVLTSTAQYQSAIGLKVNHYKLGINYKVFVSEKNALDLELDFQETGIEFIGLYNWQVPITAVEGLYWYYGFGMNAGRWANAGIRELSIGIDGQIGIEYTPVDIPFAFSIDYTPNFSVANTKVIASDTYSWRSAFWRQNWAIGIKYTFGKSSGESGVEN